MNRNQRICLWVGIAVFVLIGLFPPHYGRRVPRSGDNSSVLVTWAMAHGYWFLVSWSEKKAIDTERLCIQWAIVAVVTGGLILTFHQSPRTTGAPSRKQSDVGVP